MNYYAKAIHLISTLGRDLTEIETRIAMHHPAAFINGFVNKRFKHNLVLISNGEQKIACIKEIRSITGIGLMEAKQMTETPNAIVLNDVDYEFAKSAADALTKCGATVKISVSNVF